MTGVVVGVAEPAIRVAVGAEACVGLAVRVGVLAPGAVDVTVGVIEGVRDGVGIAVGVSVADGVAVADGAAPEVGVAVRVGVGDEGVPPNGVSVT